MINTHTDIDYDEKIRIKRTKTLIGVWDYIINNKILNPERFMLSIPLVNEVIQHYIIDLHILKFRYNIQDKIQPHKIAGLMASAILRFRPIISEKIDNYESDSEMYANEILAAIHGLAVCGEFNSPEENKKILNEPWFEPWLNNFLYLLHHRNHTAESISFIFLTLSYFKFPQNIENDQKYIMK